MLDVHPPHTPTHTWRDFLLHIATIVVGLLIAVGLEQLVETLHHRHQLHEARRAIHVELEANAKSIARNIATLGQAQQAMQRNAAVLRETNATGNIASSSLTYEWRMAYPRSNAWQDAKANGAVSYMAADERARVGYIYGDIDLSQIFAMSYLQDNNVAAAIAHRSSTLAGLTAQDRDQLLKATSDTEGQIVSCAALLTFDLRAIKEYLSLPIG